MMVTMSDMTMPCTKQRLLGLVCVLSRWVLVHVSHTGGTKKLGQTSVHGCSKHAGWALPVDVSQLLLHLTRAPASECVDALSMVVLDLLFPLLQASL